MPVPFLGRLNVSEYVALVGSFLLVGLESVIRVLTLALPSSLLLLFYRLSRRLFNRWISPEEKRAEQRRKSISTKVRNASDFVDLCALAGYTAEEHVVQTKDGYLLGLHRLAWKRDEEADVVKVNSGPRSVRKRVVYLHHGLLMNSEVWVCLTDAHRALPFVLAEKGFDVWLGNNRGNKYSKKSIHCSPTSTEFWNFSIDEFALHDIPDTIDYILEATGEKSLSYIGFSQGTAQAFASLSIFPKLNTQVNVFIALAPAMSPAGLHNGIVDALVKASPQVLFLLFGRRSILSSATMWQSILYPPIFSKAIDLGLGFLFNWKTRNISTSQKLAAYPHLYSFTSTKSVVHWFQIIRNKSFQMYDDDVHPPLTLSTSSKYTKVAKYPTRNIRTPIVLVYGGSDSLVDIQVMLRELPKQTVATEIPHYEHLDFLWARDVDEQVFPHVFDALESFTDAEHTKEEYERYRSARHHSLSQSNSYRLRRLRGHESKDSDAAGDSDVSTAIGAVVSGDETLVDADPYGEELPPVPTSIAEAVLNSDATPTIAATARMPHIARESQIPTRSGLGVSRIARPRGNGSNGAGSGPARAAVVAQLLSDEESNPSSPEGPERLVVVPAGMDGVLDGSAVTDSPLPTNGNFGFGGGGRNPVTQSPSVTAAANLHKRRTASGGSNTASVLSLESMKAGRGISLGASRAVGGVTAGTTDAVVVGGGGGSSDEGQGLAVGLGLRRKGPSR